MINQGQSINYSDTELSLLRSNEVTFQLTKFYLLFSRITILFLIITVHYFSLIYNIISKAAATTAPMRVLRKLTNSFVRKGIEPCTVAPIRLSAVVAMEAAITQRGIAGHQPIKPIIAA
mmetsp:Transcript_9624/g.12078  ORF Transcript_9624/g.12078 Transcript_9624/m.12078 type:complete len:119 (-) Transcript_9624:688-1044(-)